VHLILEGSLTAVRRPTGQVADSIFVRYCVKMKNITVTVPEDIYRRARIRAAERDTSVSALVKGFLIELASEESDAQRLEREERELRAHIRAFTAGNRLSRDDAHGRGE
jgi:hypothetical protein